MDAENCHQEAVASKEEFNQNGILNQKSERREISSKKNKKTESENKIKEVKKKKKERNGKIKEVKERKSKIKEVKEKKDKIKEKKQKKEIQEKEEKKIKKKESLNQVSTPPPRESGKVATNCSVKSCNNLLEMHYNVDEFHTFVIQFADRQAALTKLIHGVTPSAVVIDTELQHIQQRWTKAVLLKVQENAEKLKHLHITKLSERVALQKVEIEILLEKIKKLQSYESPSNLKEFQENELQERLEAQNLTVAELESQISELRERLASKKERRISTPTDIINDDTEEIGVNDEEADLTELTDDEVLQLEPQALINHIRRDLGVGSGYLSRRQRQVFKAMRTKLGSALEKLAGDIYSNESQIILEIIQNADDNSYSEGTTPLLSILVSGDKYLWITNNEEGFSNANVLAISNVGGSTKKDSSRYTGHKGIGFKSVFKVTRTPYIISKKFCFRFNLDSDLAEDNIGYILPEWVDKEELESVIAPQTIDPNMTHFYFPFSKTSCFPAEELYEGFDLIPLFLRQLHHLELCLGDKKKTVVVNRDVVNNHLSSGFETLTLSVEEKKFTDEGVNNVSVRKIKYRVFRKTFDVPRDLQEMHGGRRPQTRTELILVFPIIEDPSIDIHALEIQRVYSYLPVERAGFRFVIQGNFHLVSSRDKVHTQDLYNRWLSWMIPVAFKEAFGLGEDCNVLNNHLKDDLFFFLPSKEELARSGSSESGTDGFWRRVMQGIRDAVLETPCVLTETGKWAKPHQVRVRPKLFKDLFTNDELFSALQLEWVSERLTEKSVYGLGCQYLNSDEALLIINHDTFNVNGKSNDWFHKIYTFFGLDIKSTQDIIHTLFFAKIFPLVSGGVTSLKEGEIFIAAVSGQYDLGPKVLRLLDLQIIVLQDSNDPARKFLDMVGIKEITAVDIANSILKFQYRLKRPFQTVVQTTTEVTSSQLWEQIRFVKDHWENIGEVYPYVEAGLLVPVTVTKESLLKQDSAGNDLESSSDVKPCSYHYSNLTYLPHLITVFDKIDPDLKNRVMFLDMNQSDSETDLHATTKEWTNFLTIKLGVNNSLRVIRIFKSYELSDELNFAITRARESACTGSPQKWIDLLVHLQCNWKTLKMCKRLVSEIKTSESGYENILIRELLPDLDDYKMLIATSHGSSCIKFPSFTGLIDRDMLTDLEIPRTLSVAGLLRMIKFLQNPESLADEPLKDVTIWSKIYDAIYRLNGVPNFVFIPTSDGSGDFVKLSSIRCQIPDILKPHTNLIEFPTDLYALNPQIASWFPCLTFKDLHQFLSHILLKTEKPCKESYKQPILECYSLMNDMLANKSKHGNKYSHITLVLDRNYYLRGRKSAHLLVMPDDEHLFGKFIGERKGYCPVLFVHTEVARLPFVVDALKALEIPSLSKLMNVCPVTSKWYGYYVIPPGETEVEFPVVLSSNLTNLYRGLLAGFRDVSSKTLTDRERIHIGNLIRSTSVFVSCVDCPFIPTAYTIYGISRMVEEDYFIHETKDGEYYVIVPSNTLMKAIEDQVNLHVLKKLFPAMGEIDEYMKMLVKRMLCGELITKLDSQYLITTDQKKVIPFKIIVDDSEIVTEVQKYRKTSSDDSSSHRRIVRTSYPVLRSMPMPASVKQQKDILQSSPRQKFTPDLSSSPQRQHHYNQCPDPPVNSTKDFPDLPHHPRNTLQPTNKVVTDTSEQQTPVHRKSDDTLPKTYSSPLLKREPSATPGVQNTNDHIDNSTVQLPGPLLGSPVKKNFNENIAQGSEFREPEAEIMDVNLPDRRSDDHAEPSSGIQGGKQRFNASYHRGDDLRRIRDEIWSWSNDSMKKIESRVLGKQLELQLEPVNAESSSGVVSSFWQTLWRIENEGQSSKNIGCWAEKAAYNHFVHLCQTKQPLCATSRRLCFPPVTFDMNNWISFNRQEFEDDSVIFTNCDDTKGYDMWYKQTDGTTVYVEVKGHAVNSLSFLISAHEWEVAEKCSSSTDSVYVILGVNLNLLSLSGPSQVYMLENPFEMEKSGDILKKPHSYVVRTNIVQQNGICEQNTTRNISGKPRHQQQEVLTMTFYSTSTSSAPSVIKPQSSASSSVDAKITPWQNHPRTVAKNRGAAEQQRTKDPSSATKEQNSKKKQKKNSAPNNSKNNNYNYKKKPTSQ